MKVEYSPAVKKALPAREAPARIVTSTDEELLAQGYIKAGSIKVRKVIAECYGNNLSACIEEARRSARPCNTSAELRKKAAEKGGDVVVLTLMDKIGPESITKNGRCLDWRQEHRSGPLYEKGRVVGTRYWTENRCVSHETLYGTGLFEKSEGAVWSGEENSGEHPLALAVRKNDLARTAALLKSAKSIDSVRDIDNLPVLVRAVRNRNQEMIKLLLDGGVSPNVKSENGTPLYNFVNYANDRKNNNRVVMYNPPLLQLFIKYGADVNDDVPIDSAAQYGLLEYLRILLSAGASKSINEKDSFKNTPLVATLKWYHGDKARLPEIIRLLLENGAAVDIRNDEKETPLLLASAPDRLEIARLLIRHGAASTINMPGSFYKTTPLIAAASRDCKGDGALLRARAELIRLLIDNGADIKAANIYNETALHCAALQGDTGSTEILLTRGAAACLSVKSDYSGKVSYNLRPYSGMTPLMTACYMSPNAAMARLLIKQGARPDEIDTAVIEQFKIESQKQKKSAAVQKDFDSVTAYISSLKK
jgi:ankyrin repeat protein